MLESSHKLWTTLDTTNAKKTINQKSLAIHFRRSKWTLDRAVLTMKAIDSKGLAYITKYCKMLKDLQMHGRGMIADSLTSALKDAKSLETLYVSQDTEITLSAVQTAIGHCKNSLVTATFLKVTGPRGGFLSGRWPVMEPIKTLHLESDGESVLDIVSTGPQGPQDVPQ